MQNIAMHALTIQQPQPHAIGLRHHGLAGLLDHEDYQPAEYNDEGDRGYRENIGRRCQNRLRSHVTINQLDNGACAIAHGRAGVQR